MSSRGLQSRWQLIEQMRRDHARHKRDCTSPPSPGALCEAGAAVAVWATAAPERGWLSRDLSCQLQPGNLKDPILVWQPLLEELRKYWLTYQKVQSSTGSTFIEV